MVAVRYDSLQPGGHLRYQGRYRLPGKAVQDSAGATIPAVSGCGYAWVVTPPKTHPDAIRGLLVAEFAAGRWSVWAGGERGMVPVGVPLAVSGEGQ